MVRTILAPTRTRLAPTVRFSPDVVAEWPSSLEEAHDDRTLAFILEEASALPFEAGVPTSPRAARLGRRPARPPATLLNVEAERDDVALEMLLSANANQLDQHGDIFDNDGAARKVLEPITVLPPTDELWVTGAAPYDPTTYDPEPYGPGLPDEHQPSVPDIVASVSDMVWRSHNYAKITIVAGGHGRGDELNQLCCPIGLVASGSNSVLVADYGNRRVVRWGYGERHQNGAWAQGSIMIEARDPSFRPVGLAVDGANALLVSAGSDLVFFPRFPGEGVHLVSGSWPTGIALDRTGAPLFADTFAHTVIRCRWALDGSLKEEVLAGNRDTACFKQTLPETSRQAWGPPRRRACTPTPTRKLNRPFGIALDDTGAVFIADSGNHCVVRWARGATEGQVVAGGHGRGGRLDQLNSPRGVVVEAPDVILVADTLNDRVIRWRRGASRGELVAGGRGHSYHQLSRPAGLAIDDTGALLIADSGNHRVVRCCC